jgi:CRP-like cAMP-binding protein
MAPRDNAVLARLDEASLAQLAPFMELVALRRGQWLYEAAEPVRYLYFPVGAVVGIRCELPDGQAADVLLLDREGCGPVQVLTGDGSVTSAVVRHGGPCYRLPASVFKSAMRSNESLFTQTMWACRISNELTSLASVCLRKHPTENLVAGWLLVGMHATHSAQLRLTHRDIAQSLGVRREAVTLTLNKYAEHGLVELARGRVHLIDPEGLQRWTCSCFATWNHCRQSAPPAA